MNWITVKNFGQVKYFNISYAVLILVPIIANIFYILNTKFSYILILPETVKWLYTASLIYAIAIAIYQYKCPTIIKEYATIQEYIDKNQKQFENKFPDLKLNTVLANLNPIAQKETYDKIVSLHERYENTLDHNLSITLRVELDTLLNTVFSSSIQNHLTQTFNNATVQGKWYIWISGLLFIAGTLIILSLLIIKTFVVYNN